ncbi:MAG: PhoH family protein, partial [Caulobacteraceae bacterium]
MSPPKTEEFLPLSEIASRAVSGPRSRHAALLEDAFHVLVETPGGGVSLRGDAKGRAAAKRAIEAIAQRADSGADMAEADIRVAIASSRHGEGSPQGGSLPVGRRGAIAPKTAAQARYLEMLL